MMLGGIYWPIVVWKRASPTAAAVPIIILGLCKRAGSAVRPAVRPFRSRKRAITYRTADKLIGDWIGAIRS